MTFAENMKSMPDIDHVNGITLYEDQAIVGQIPNAEGKKNSLKIYCHLLGFVNGAISPDKAEEGLALYAEHVADAKVNPGKHPNIDILFDVLQGRKINAVIELS